ncbi:MAG: hypothetical protein ACFCVK_04445 [Acidimicrobiales bacterium]
MIQPSGVRGELAVADFRSALLDTTGHADPRPFQLAGCKLAGQLDLRNVDVGVPLRFLNCEFEQPVLLDGAHLRTLSLEGCEPIPGIVANGTTIDGNLIIDNTKIVGAVRTVASMRQTAAVWLCEARIGGRLLIRNGSTIDGCRGRSIQADRIVVGANIRILDRSKLVGELRLLSARVAGSLDIVSSTVETHDELAVELAEATFDGSLFLARTTPTSAATVIDGVLTTSDVRIGAFVSIKGARLVGRTVRADGAYDRPNRHAARVAVSAARCQIGDDLHIDDECEITGGLIFAHAAISGDVVFLPATEPTSSAPRRGLRITNPHDRALDFGGADIRGDLIANHAEIRGTAWLAGCTVGGSLFARGAELSDPADGAALAAAGLTAGGDVVASGLTTSGGVVGLRAASVRGDVELEGAVLTNPEGETLSLSNARVEGAVRLNDLVSNGLVAINRASVRGRLQLSGATLTCGHIWDKNRHGRALEIISSDIEGGLFLDWQQAAPSVDVFSSTTTILADVADRWPASADLSGFVYDRLDAVEPGRDAWSIDDRLRVLSSQDPFELAPYEIAARVFADHGRFSEADRIRIEGRRELARSRRRAASGSTSWHARVQGAARQAASSLYDVTVRFGFEPARALAIILGLIIAVWLTLTGPWSAGTDAMRAAGASGTIYSPDGPVANQTAGDDEPAARCGADVTCFRPFVYAVETVVPLLELDQRATWHVDSSSRTGSLLHTWLTVATISGWTLSSVFVLSFSRLGRTS